MIFFVQLCEILAPILFALTFLPYTIGYNRESVLLVGASLGQGRGDIGLFFTYISIDLSSQILQTALCHFLLRRLRPSCHVFLLAEFIVANYPAMMVFWSLVSAISATMINAMQYFGADIFYCIDLVGGRR